MFGGGLQVTTTLDIGHAADGRGCGRRAADRPRGSRRRARRDRPAGPAGSARCTAARTSTSEHVNLATGAGGTGRAGGLLVQGRSRSSRRSSRSTDSIRVWNGPSSITIPDPAVLHGRRAVGAVERERLGERGTFTLLSATTHSVNTVFAQVASAVGPDAIVDVAHRMGIRSPLEPVCSITLGTQSVTPLEMTRAYATLAARGWRHQATPLQRGGGPERSRPTRSTREASRCSTRTMPTWRPRRSRR